ncbi:MAG: cyclic nucleotide-binding domain-containing protein [Acidobacteria bacterium]|nr:MAG: cyclic nucleotide-binding domain-containing protein [Acidobacteriota bacterium]
MEIADRLRQFEVLSHFTDEQIATLASCTTRMRFPPGATIFEEGEESRDAYLIDTGLVRIQRRTPYGEYALADLRNGEMFGESSFIDGNPRSGAGVVVDPSVLFPLSVPAIRAALERDKRFTMALYWAFWKSLSGKLRSTNETLARFFSKSGGTPPARGPESTRQANIHVGVDAKRNLFREQKLSRLEINLLASLSQEQRLAGGEVLFREGQEGDRMYVVLEGKVMISKQIAGAGEEALAILERGDYFGEMALIDQQPRSADAKAHEDGAVVLSISREVLETILDIQKVSSISLLRLLCDLVAKRLREIDDKLIGWYIFDAGSGESLKLPD